MTRLSVAVVLAASALSACTPGQEVTVTPRIVVTVGVLSVGQSGGVACIWIDTPNGSRRELILTRGWALQGDPVRLTNPAGTEAARVGDAISVTGRGDIAGASVCSGDPPLVAESVVKVALASPVSSAHRNVIFTSNTLRECPSGRKRRGPIATRHPLLVGMRKCIR